MKKLILVLSMLAAFGIGGVSSASAGNCTGQNSTPVVFPGNGTGFNFTAQLYNCTGVSQVQFGIATGNTGYINDSTTNVNHAAYSFLGNYVQSNPCASAGNPNPCQLTYLVGSSWCLGTRLVSTYFPFRIQSIDIHGVRTWGPYHTTIGWNGYVFC